MQADVRPALLHDEVLECTDGNWAGGSTLSCLQEPVVGQEASLPKVNVVLFTPAHVAPPKGTIALSITPSSMAGFGHRFVKIYELLFGPSGISMVNSGSPLLPVLTEYL